MEFFLGLLTAVAFFIAFYLGTRYRTKKPTITADDEELRKARKNREDFMELMNYDVEKALKGKKSL